MLSLPPSLFSAHKKKKEKEETKEKKGICAKKKARLGFLPLLE